MNAEEIADTESQIAAIKGDLPPHELIQEHFIAPFELSVAKGEYPNAFAGTAPEQVKVPYTPPQPVYQPNYYPPDYGRSENEDITANIPLDDPNLDLRTCSEWVVEAARQQATRSFENWHARQLDERVEWSELIARRRWNDYDNLVDTWIIPVIRADRSGKSWEWLRQQPDPARVAYEYAIEIRDRTTATRTASQ
jgi:hypothetical protein